MASNSSVSFAVLDPDAYKASLVTYLKSQTIFKDYDFTGSNINVILDILAHNTYQNAFYMNMTFSEMFLDTAQLRNSVISRVKEMQYIPGSRTSSHAIVDIEVQANTTTLEIPNGLRFTGSNENSSYSFITNENSIYISANGYFHVPNLSIYDGFYTTDTFVVDYQNETQTFVLSNPSVDISSISVSLTENGNLYNLSKATNLFGLDNNSYIYFLQASFNDKYEIIFGDGISGHQPLNNSVVQITYRVCAGIPADGVLTFTMSDDLATINNTAISSLTITTVQPSTGGGDVETIPSIKYNATMSVMTQDRAIVPSDYKQLILQNFSYTRDVHVYGGTVTSTSVDYGKVFMSIINKSGNIISQSQKQDIITFISERNPQGITPEVIDPDNIYLDITSTVHVDIPNTLLTVPQYNAMITNGIINYNSSNLEMFDTAFRFSKLSDTIDSLDKFILSNETTVVMKKNIEVPLNTNYNCSVNFMNPFNKGTVSSSKFISNGITYYMSDMLYDGTITGNLYLINFYTPSLYTTIGSLDYKNGIINTKSVYVNNYLNSPGIVFYATSTSKDIYGYNNNIIQIDITTIGINIVNN
jgi:hypothetical protein